MPSRSLGIIPDGPCAGIEVIDLSKHRGIDPAKYTGPHRLRVDTDPYGRGSKWLATMTDEMHFDLVKRVLEAGAATLGGPKRVYRLTVDQSVGVTAGHLVSSVEVRFDGRYAHGYPGPP